MSSENVFQLLFDACVKIKDLEERCNVLQERIKMLTDNDEEDVHYGLFPDNEMTDGAKLGQEMRVLKAYGLDDTTLLYLYKSSFKTVGDLGHLLDVSPDTIKNIKGIGPARYKRIVDAFNVFMRTAYSNDYYDGR
jgi:hypothetical protein